MMRSIPACDQSIDDIPKNLQSGQIVQIDSIVTVWLEMSIGRCPINMGF